MNCYNVLVLGTAWGNGQVVRRSVFASDLASWCKNGRMWMVNTNSYCIQSLAFSANAEDPAGML